MIILASASIVRAKILRDFNIPFVQKPLNFDEDAIQTKNPKEFVYQATIGKFQNALKHFGEQSPILVADSVVNVSGVLQRKAKNKEEAKMFLQSQSGSNIEIITCMIYHSCKLQFIDISATKYELDTFQPKHFNDYLTSKEWVGKAGCVMVEGFHKSYIKSQVGLENTALGLPIERILPFLEII